MRVVFCRQQAADWSRWDADNAAMTSAVQRALREGLPVRLDPNGAVHNNLTKQLFPAETSKTSLTIGEGQLPT